jgi:hypothetical protein
MVNPRLSLEHASRRCFSLATRCENSAKLGKRFERKEVPRQRVAASIPGRFRAHEGCAKLAQFRRGLRYTLSLRTVKPRLWGSRRLTATRVARGRTKFHSTWIPPGREHAKKRICHVWAFKMGHH